MDSSASCPFCNLTVPFTELERHANSHFDNDDEYDEQFARDHELALQIASSPTNYQAVSERPINDTFSHKACETSTSSRVVGGGGQCDIEGKVSCLIDLQIRSNFYHVNDGLMSLLRKCLELEPGNSTSYLSGYVDHFQSVVSEDVGWGCGWRNIQMLGSHLLARRQDVRDFLFGGSGFVPDIPSLQRWLEIAWERGFDTVGSQHFNQNIYGSRNRIGTTECAALFRSFRLRARIVDFGPKEFESLYLSVPGTTHEVHATKANTIGKRKALQVFGPMDRYIPVRNHDVSQSCSIQNEPSRDSSNQFSENLGSGTTNNIGNNSRTKSESHQILMDWVWNYFSDKASVISGHRRVIISDKGPLYFQHDGHSRTIVGIQVINQRNGIQRYNLLILDPGHRTPALERSLKENNGWRKLIKRGVHTLRKPQYQLCYIDPGIADGEEMEQLKTLDSVFITL